MVAYSGRLVRGSYSIRSHFGLFDVCAHIRSRHRGTQPFFSCQNESRVSARGTQFKHRGSSRGVVRILAYGALSDKTRAVLRQKIDQSSEKKCQFSDLEMLPGYSGSEFEVIGNNPSYAGGKVISIAGYLSEVRWTHSEKRMAGSVALRA